MANIDAAGQSVREINQAIRQRIGRKEAVTVQNPGARHNLGVALLEAGEVRIAGSVGYYCGGWWSLCPLSFLSPRRALASSFI